MATKNGGGQAFPNSRGESGCAPGMSLRAWLAGQALQGLASQHLSFGINQTSCSPWSWVAEQSVKAADALIAELEKQP